MENAQDTRGMFELARTVRFCINPWSDASGNSPPHNTFAGWPSMHGLGAYYELEIVCRGQPDPLTGYMINISSIDRAVRAHALSIIEQAVRQGGAANVHQALADVNALLSSALEGIVWSVRWRLTPYYSIAMDAAHPNQISISQQFEFSAAHRLNVATLSSEQNLAIFGKCNNENGHGHNYRLQVEVAVPLGSEPRDATSLVALEHIVNKTVVQRFDHKHLNLDTVEFATLNPSVENIARVCHDLLRGPLAQSGFKLERVSIWETEKTRCTYPAGA